MIPKHLSESQENQSPEFLWPISALVKSVIVVNASVHDIFDVNLNSERCSRVVEGGADQTGGWVTLHVLR